MNSHAHRLPQMLVLAIPVAIAAYVFAVGADEFYHESFGTLILSPLIYLRFCPDSVALPVGRFMLDHPWSVHAVCGFPVALLLAAAVLGFLGFRRNSLPLSLLALLITAAVFCTYHFLQPLGFSVLAADWPGLPQP